MSPRTRLPKNRKLVTNLYPHHRSGFLYRDPITGERKYVPGPEASANAYARKRNAGLGVEQIDSVGYQLEQYQNEKLRGTEATKREARRIIKVYRDVWGNAALRSINRLALVEAWDLLKGPHARQKHRDLWIKFMRWALSRGRIDVNEAALTEKIEVDMLERKRLRHTDEGFKATYEAAEDWLKIAIELAVSSLQRRGDLVRLTREDVREARLYVAQAKSIKKGQPKVRLAIKIKPETRLARAIIRAREFPVFGPTLIRRQPERRYEKTNKVNASFLTQAFAEARDRSGAYADLPPNLRPAFHDLRAYGVWCYERAGFPREYIQALAGHSTAKMTAHYAEGHEIVWQQVEAGL